MYVFMYYIEIFVCIDKCCKTPQGVSSSYCQKIYFSGNFMDVL